MDPTSLCHYCLSFFLFFFFLLLLFLVETSIPFIWVEIMITWSHSFLCPLLTKIQVGVSDLHFWGFKLPLPPTSQIIEVGSFQKHFQNQSCQQCTFHAYSLTALCKQTDPNSTKQLGAWRRKEMCNMWLGKILVGEQPGGVYEMWRDCQWWWT